MSEKSSHQDSYFDYLLSSDTFTFSLSFNLFHMFLATARFSPRARCKTIAEKFLVSGQILFCWRNNGIRLTEKSPGNYILLLTIPLLLYWNTENCLFWTKDDIAIKDQVSIYFEAYHVNLFVPGAPFLYPLKTSEN